MFGTKHIQKEVNMELGEVGWGLTQREIVTSGEGLEGVMS